MDDSGDAPDSVVETGAGESVGDADVDGSTPPRRVSRVPSDAPDRCPVCDADYDSVSLHDAGLLVNLLDNDRYHRVCFEPTSREGVAMVRFYHHSHEQVE